ncbi:MAG TPA: DUF1499 domain-containing protein [Burkholderiales bacterium]
MWLSRAALALGILAVLLLLVSGPGVRLGLWPWQTGFLLLRAAVFVGAGAMLLSLIAFSIPRARSMSLLGALALGVAAAAVPLEFQRRARAVPPINDISTAGDTAPAMAEQQRRAYPDVQPLMLSVPPDEAFGKARTAALDMGWEIVSADPAAGRIEAVATTFWFGFRDDVTVRVTPQGGSSRIDVRSKSRVGRGDAGANAGRIRRYLKMF